MQMCKRNLTKIRRLETLLAYAHVCVWLPYCGFEPPDSNNNDPIASRETSGCCREDEEVILKMGAIDS
jgi:hypothetical protein